MIAISLVASSLTVPATATRPTAGAYVAGNLLPGATLNAYSSDWPLPGGVTINSYQWYRCDTLQPAVDLTTSAITIPPACSAIPGATGSTYTIDSDLGSGLNSDEGKFLSVLLQDDDTTPKRALSATMTNFVIVNRNGGTNASDGMRIIMSNGGFQVYRNNTFQVYADTRAGRGTYGGSAAAGPALLAEGNLLLPDDQASVDVNDMWGSSPSQVAWDSVITTMISENLVTDSFVASTVFTKTISGRVYTMTMELSYKSPSELATIEFSVAVPAGTPSDVNLFYALDMYLDGNDFGPGTTTYFGPRRLVAQYNATGFGGLLEASGPAFGSWVEQYYECAFGFQRARCDPAYGPSSGIYPNTVNDSVVDAGVGVQWNLGRTAGTMVRQMKLAFGSSEAPAINVTYSQSSIKTNKRIYTFIDILNSLNSVRLFPVGFTLNLPSATYGTPTSTCGGTVTLTSNQVVLSGGDIASGTTTCQIVFPTTFTTPGVRSVDSSNLVSSSWTSPSATGVITDLLGESVDVSNGGPDPEAYTITADTNAASSVDKTSATLNGTATATVFPVDVRFCYGTSSALTGCTSVAASPDSVSPGVGATSVSKALTGLSPGTTYYYKLSADNGIETKSGAIRSFTTDTCWEQLTGGNISADERVLRFTYSAAGCTWPVPTGVTEVKALVVAGGGGGGAPCVAGGGGGGGVRYLPTLAVTGSIAITIGQGGSGASGGGCAGGRGSSGGDTTLGGLATAIGGGGGGSYNAGFNGAVGGSGGGGSGGAGGSTPGVHYGTGGNGTAGQGYAGGDGDHDVPGNPGGGGGGAGGVGSAPSAAFGGAGGPGVQSAISGSDEYYGAGGGGASDEAGKGGLGGSSCGGTGASPGTSAAAGTGYGCGGGGGNAGFSGGAGSDGVVVLRYSVPPSPPSPSPGGSSDSGSSSSSSAVPIPPSLPASLDPVQTSTVLTSPVGSGVVLVDGVPTPVTWSNPARGAVQVSGSDWTLTMRGDAPRGRGGAGLDVTSGGSVLVSGSGFKPGTLVPVYAFSRSGAAGAPLLLGTLPVGADGSFSGRLVIPSTFAPGAYIIQANGYGPQMQVRSASISASVVAPKGRTIKRIRTKVFFSELSAVLTPTGKKRLNNLISRIPRDARSVTVQSSGYVRPTPSRDNDLQLSTARARVVAIYLRDHGVKGDYRVTGWGRSKIKSARGQVTKVIIAYARKP